MNKDIYRKIYKIIKDYDKIVISRHVGPDPDAIGSQLALRDSIKLTFPNKEVYAIGAGVSRFKHMGALDKVEDYNDLEGSLLIVLDVPNFSRVDGIEGLSYNAILKIDHHPREDIMGNVDWTDESMASTCEMVANFLLNSKMVIDQKIAENLFLGIVSDSDRFLLSNTTIDTFKTTVQLLEKVPFNFVSSYEKLYEQDFKEVQFSAYLINNLNITDNQFGYIIIEKNILDKYQADPAIASNLVNDFHSIKELVCWAFAVYDLRNEIYKINIRSKGPVINEIASNFNGGGHKYASGARIKTRKEVDELFKALDKASEEYLNIEYE